jgi:hypothetical protein
LGLTLLVALIAVWWFKITSVLRGDKDKNKVKEAWMKLIGARNNTAFSGAKAQDVVMTGALGDRPGSSRKVPNTVEAPTVSEGEQDADGGGSRLSRRHSTRKPTRKGHASGDVENGLGCGCWN